MIRIALVTLCSAIVALGCGGATGPLMERLSSEEQREYSQALDALGRDREAGIAALEAFVDTRPRSPLADDAALRLAELALEDGREEEALQHLVWLVRRHPKGNRSDLARIALASIQRERGHPEAAYRTASEIRLSLLASDPRREAHRLLADLAGENGDRAAQLRWLSRVRADQPDEEAAASIDAEIEQLLLGMDSEALEAAADQLGKRVPAARLRMRQAELALQAGDFAKAEAALALAAKLPLSESDVTRFAALETALRERAAHPRDLLSSLPSLEEVLREAAPDATGAVGTLGVVLPLSGPLATYGEESLLGVLLAAEIFDAARPGGGSKLRVLVYDTGGSAAAAAVAVRRLSEEPDLVAIIGPLFAEEAESAAAASEAEAVPLVTLTRREGVALRRRHVFRMGATPRLQAELLADYATRELGNRRFAILYPRDDYGLAMRAAFWDAVEARGGTVVGVAPYDPAATDFAQPIRRIIGYEFLSVGEREALAEREKLMKRAKRMPPEQATELREEAAALTGPTGEPLPPFVDFDALFIPDSHENAALIAPHLAFHEVRGVRLLGPSGWNHPDLLRIGGRHLDGAVFTGEFYAQSSLPFVIEFVRRFQETYGREPSFLGAQAFDATRLVMLQLVRGRDTRRLVVEGLLATRAYPGVSGITNIRPDGNAAKRPYLLGVHRGRLISIDESGEPPYLHVPEPELPEDPEASAPELPSS